MGGFLGKRDLVSDFQHVKLSRTGRHYMAFRHPVHGRLQCDVVLQPEPARPSSWSSQGRPGTFSRLSVIGVASARSCSAEVAQELGLEWKPLKDCDQDQPRQEMEFLSMLFETVRGEMCLAHSKRQHQQIAPRGSMRPGRLRGLRRPLVPAAPMPTY